MARTTEMSEGLMDDSAFELGVLCYIFGRCSCNVYCSGITCNHYWPACLPKYAAPAVRVHTNDFVPAQMSLDRPTLPLFNILLAARLDTVWYRQKLLVGSLCDACRG